MTRDRSARDVVVTRHAANYHASESEARNDEQRDVQFREPARPLLDRLIFLGVLGNHDKNSRRYYEIVKPPGGKSWFTLSHKSVTFFGLDTNKNLWSQGEQGRWFEEELKKCGEPWKVVLLHAPRLHRPQARIIPTSPSRKKKEQEEQA